jgi:hypothetical protein
MIVSNGPLADTLLASLRPEVSFATLVRTHPDGAIQNRYNLDLKQVKARSNYDISSHFSLALCFSS